MVHGSIDEDALGNRAVALMPRPVRRRISPDEAARVIAGGIERRAPTTIAPAAWRPLRWGRGLGGLVDAAIARDPRVRALIRKTEARTARQPV
jgi:hypothetical protein